MGFRHRVGTISLAILLAGIFFVLLIFALMAMRNQAQASSLLKDDLKQANLSLVATGLPPATAAEPAVEGIQTDKTKSSTYQDDEYSLVHPSFLKPKKIKAGHLELASREEYFGAGSVPKGEALLKLVTVQFNGSPEDYAARSPYQVSQKVDLINSKQVLRLVNRLNGTEWLVTVIIDSPAGPAHILTGLPSSPKVQDAMEMVLSSLKVKATTPQ